MEVLICLLAILPLTLAGPYQVTYYGYPTAGHIQCSTQVRRLHCYNLNGYECCEAPPSHNSFPTVQGFTSGPAGVLIFHSLIASTGGCGGCTTTGSLNTCYENSPFETTSIFPVGYKKCIDVGNQSPSKRSENGVMSKGPGKAEGGDDTIPSVCRKLNVVSIGEMDYALDGVKVDDEFVENLMHMTEEDFVKKYDLKPYVEEEDSEVK